MIQINDDASKAEVPAIAEPEATMTPPLRKRLETLYSAFKLAKIDFLLNAFDPDIEFISYSPLKVFPFLGHQRGKAAMAEILRAGYEQFEFITYEPVLMVCEGEDSAAVMVFARFTHHRTGRSILTMIAHFLRFRQGLIIELREFMDSFGAVSQLLGRPLDLRQV